MPGSGSASAPFRSTTRTSGSSISLASSWRVTSCPAARSAPSTFEPNSRSGQIKATRAIRSLGAPAPELLAHRFRAPPHLHHLDPPHAHLAELELALDPGLVEHGERTPDGLRSGGVAELARHADAPVPVVAGGRPSGGLRGRPRGPGHAPPPS